MKCQQPSEGFFSLQTYVIMSQRITAGCQLCSAWIQTEIVERELPLPVKMAQEMVKQNPYASFLSTGAQNCLSITENRKKYPSYIGQFTLVSICQFMSFLQSQYFVFVYFLVFYHNVFLLIEVTGNESDNGTDVKILVQYI